jgi:hypothetical protein
VWFVNDNQAYMEYICEDSLQNYQISTGNFQEASIKMVEKNGKQENCFNFEHLIPITKDKTNVISNDYDLFENFIGHDPCSRISSDPKVRVTKKSAKCYRHKKLKDKYVLLWDVDNDLFLPELISEDDLECLQSSNALDLHIDSNTVAMDFVSSLDVSSLTKHEEDDDLNEEEEKLNEECDDLNEEVEDEHDEIEGDDEDIVNNVNEEIIGESMGTLKNIDHLN